MNDPGITLFPRDLIANYSPRSFAIRIPGRFSDFPPF